MARGHLEIEPIFGRISTLRPFFGHFYIIKCDKSKNVSRFGLHKYIGEEIRVKKILQKNGTWTHNVLSIEFLESLIGYNSKTTPPRVKILPPVDFLGSNYPNKKFSSRNSKFSVFDTLAFFSTSL